MKLFVGPRVGAGKRERRGDGGDGDDDSDGDDSRSVSLYRTWLANKALTASQVLVGSHSGLCQDHF